MKKCKRCNVPKSKKMFNKNAQAKDGLFDWCRECQKEHFSDYYEKNKDRLLSEDKVTRRKRQSEIEQIKNKPCADCGMTYPSYVMDFDHVRGQKSFVVSQFGNMAWKTVLKEIRKCDVVCSNCHRIRTFTRRKDENLV
jgi:hypothetical protein